jgi:DNA recombination protein RmuC
MSYLLIVLLVIMLAVILLLLFLLMQLRKENRQIARSLLKSQNQLMVSDSASEKKSAQDFEVLLSQIQQLSRMQSGTHQSVDWIQSQVSDMNRVMANAKSRGSWGEYQLEMLLENYCGASSKIYERQYTLDNGKIADTVFHVPGSKKVLCIDSKFPMENYNAIQNDPDNEAIYLRAFKQNVKKHIDDIANKYINHNTLDQAIMFIPSEAIYQFVLGECTDLFDYAMSRHVLFSSPTSLMAIVFPLLSSSRDLWRSQHVEEVEKELLSLQQDVLRLHERADKAKRQADQASEALAGVQISANKIYEKMNALARPEQKGE